MSLFLLSRNFFPRQSEGTWRRKKRKNFLFLSTDITNRSFSLHKEERNSKGLPSCFCITIYQISLLPIWCVIRASTISRDVARQQASTQFAWKNENAEETSAPRRVIKMEFFSSDSHSNQMSLRSTFFIAFEVAEEEKRPSSSQIRCKRDATRRHFFFH